MRRALPGLLIATLLVGCSPPSTSSAPADAGPDSGTPPGPDAAAPSDGGLADPDGGAAANGCEAFFRLDVPEAAGAAAVVLTGDFAGWAATAGSGAIAMTHQPDGAWSVIHPLDPGPHRYKFVIDGATWLADPSNPEAEDDGFGGHNSLYRCVALASCGDPDSFDWRDSVMYFALVDRFFDSDGHADPVSGVSDGDAATASSGQYEGGDLAGVRAKLGYLADLGVTSIWLSAPYDNRDSAGAGSSDDHSYSGYHGYWPSPAAIDYSDPDAPQPRPLVESRLGDEATLHALIADAHASASADGHGIKVLFDYVMKHVDDSSDLYAAHPDWFLYDDDGSGFRSCGASCGDHLCWDDPYWTTRCAFTSYLPPLDLYNPAVRAWSIRDAVWWARTFDLDGYRLDAIKHVPMEWLTALRDRLGAGPTADRFYMVGETFDYFNRGLLASFVDPATRLDGQFDFPFKRALCQGLFDPAGSLAGLAAFAAGNDTFYGPGSIMTTWIGNHDVPRAIGFAAWQLPSCTEGSHAGNSWTGNFPQPTGAAPYERLGLAFAAMMTGPGIPLIYYGDEVGLAGGGDPDNRRMMPWDDSALAAPQLALRARVRRLARLRGSLVALGRGTRQTLSADRDTWVYRMGCAGGSGDAAPVIVALNRADATRSVPLPAGTYVDRMTDQPVGGSSLELPPRGFAVLTAP
jgi:glycosidase